MKWLMIYRHMRARAVVVKEGITHMCVRVRARVHVRMSGQGNTQRPQHSTIYPIAVGQVKDVRHATLYILTVIIVGSVDHLWCPRHKHAPHARTHTQTLADTDPALYVKCAPAQQKRILLLSLVRLRCFSNAHRTPSTCVVCSHVSRRTVTYER